MADIYIDTFTFARQKIETHIIWGFTWLDTILVGLSRLFYLEKTQKVHIQLSKGSTTLSGRKSAQPQHLGDLCWNRISQSLIYVY